MKQFGYIVVEGQHDIEFIAHFFRLFRFRRVQYLAQLENFWKRLIPTSFPFEDDLLRRVPIPIFFENDTHSIAIHSANGDSNIARIAIESINALPTGKIIGYGFFLDTDSQKSPTQRFSDFKTKLMEQSFPFPIPDNPGEMIAYDPKVGIYIIPDNQNQGTLENILIDVAQINYQGLLSSANNYINGIDLSQLLPEDLEEFNKPAGRNKAIVASLSGVLRPGKSIQVSIQDNRWLTGDAMNLPKVNNILDFLVSLFTLR